MAKKENEKVVKASNDVNDELVRELSASFNVNLEKAWWAKARKMVEGGAISVRGLKATIKKVEDTFGNAPTLRSTWSQYFTDAFAVEDLEGGKEQSLKAILNLTIQATRKAGGRDGFAEILEGAKSFKDFAKKVESMPKKEKGESEKGADLVDVDAYISIFMGVKELTDLKIRNVDQWEKFLNMVKVISQANRANHPAVRSKVSA